MAVKTPTYWQEEKYQPLVEVETLYGNKVMIPQMYEEDWEFYRATKEIMIDYLKELVPDGYLAETSNPRKQWAVDLKKVFYELYGIQNPAELILKEE
jgi:hypothetical protein